MKEQYQLIIINTNEERAPCRTCGEIGDVQESSPGHHCLVLLLFEEVTTW
jgi:hypothetical protein